MPVFVFVRIGAGRWVLDEFVTNDYLLFHQFEDYHKELTQLDVILSLAKKLMQQVDYSHHPIRLIGLSVSNPIEEKSSGLPLWTQLMLDFPE